MRMATIKRRAHHTARVGWHGVEICVRNGQNDVEVAVPRQTPLHRPPSCPRGTSGFGGGRLRSHRSSCRTCSLQIPRHTAQHKGEGGRGSINRRRARGRGLSRHIHTTSRERKEQRERERKKERKKERKRKRERKTDERERTAPPDAQTYPPPSTIVTRELPSRKARPDSFPYFSYICNQLKYITPEKKTEKERNSLLESAQLCGPKRGWFPSDAQVTTLHPTVVTPTTPTVVAPSTPTVVAPSTPTVVTPSTPTVVARLPSSRFQLDSFRSRATVTFHLSLSHTHTPPAAAATGKRCAVRRCSDGSDDDTPGRSPHRHGLAPQPPARASGEKQLLLLWMREYSSPGGRCTRPADSTGDR